MTFIFVDRVLKLERDKSIVAVRQVSLAEDIFTQHFPGRPMMPASLLIEAVAQAATILLDVSSGFSSKAFVGYVSNSKFRVPVIPGHEMRLEVDLLSADDGGAVLKGRVFQREKRCANVELGMVRAPLKEFIPPRYLNFYLGLFEAWLGDTEFTGFDQDPRVRLANVQS